jgi:putative ABC transport system substrate-binding protein
MRRRNFVQGIAASTAWPLTARAQQPGQMRRVGLLMNRTADDAEGQAALAAFQEGLRQTGWSDGRNVQTLSFVRAAAIHDPSCHFAIVN